MAIRNRWSAYAGLSAALAGGVVVKALVQRPNYYSAAVYLAQSSANVMILANLVFVTACSLLIALQKLLYGPLRPIEIEQLYEKAWFAITETCLAMTIFRGEIGVWFLVMFFSLLAGKVWAWIGEGRVEILEQQPPRNPRLFHTRLALSLGLSVLFDLSMLEYVSKQVLRMTRPDMMVMFGFEFAVLSIMSLSTAMRYAINLVEIGIVRGQKRKRMEEIRKERVAAAVREIQSTNNSARNAEGDTTNETTTTTPQVMSSPEAAREALRAAEAAAAQPIDETDLEVEGWEGKGRWIFYLDLLTDFVKLVVYLSFFFILLIFYGLPLHIMRDVFLTCRSFFKRVGDFVRYRTATRDMNERYPDATAEEIHREDVCIICREEMRPYQPPADGAQPDPVAQRMRPKKLPCGHILHFSCLRSWLERQQICPTCRATVVPTTQTSPGATRPGVPGAAGAAGVGAAPAQHPNAPAGNRGPRVYQFGPLRIGVGAARGNNMFEQLEHQLANADAQHGQQQNVNAPQQYGFGIRWDGMRRRGHPRHIRGTVQEQLEAAERQIQRELDSLQASMGELNALRSIQAQMARIRAMRETQHNIQQTAQQITNSAFRVAPTTTTPLMGDSHNGVLHAGSDQLPNGLTLPEGWTMMPLQPLQSQMQSALPQSQTPFSNQTDRTMNIPPSTAAPPTLSQNTQANSAVSQPRSQSESPVPVMNGSLNTGQQPGSNVMRQSASGTSSTLQRTSLPRSRLPQENGSSLDARVNSPPVESTSEITRSLRDVGHNSSGGSNHHVNTHDNEDQANSGSMPDNNLNSTSTSQPTPTWGFGNMESNGSQSDDRSVEGLQNRSNGLHQSTTGIDEERQKRRNPTVEDLVEGPD